MEGSGKSAVVVVEIMDGESNDHSFAAGLEGLPQEGLAIIPP